MIVHGAQVLKERAADINALNVFPVPDGDTGTNMQLTFSAGVQAVLKSRSEHIGQVAEALAKGLLMGARGNSGVILSQLFRGFAKGASGKERLSAMEFAQALQQGVDTAYQAVAKPVEGTILSVAREAAKSGIQAARRGADFSRLMKEVLQKARETLAQTPQYLSVLKQVGVVDAGGQGLVYLYEAFLDALSGEREAEWPSTDENPPAELAQKPIKAQAHLANEDIEYGYCTEFMIRLDIPHAQEGFDETRFRGELAKMGDSLLVVNDDGWVKVHLHTERPGDALNLALKYGELDRIKIENMRQQHAQIVRGEAGEQRSLEGDHQRKTYGIVAVAAGDGMARIFKSLGADSVVSGGLSMNPSTEDILRAVGEVKADCVFVLPNNPNVILAALQAGKLAKQTVEVIPTKTMPQGLAALVAFKGEADPQQNKLAMERAAQQVRTGRIARAAKNTTIGDVQMKEGHFVALQEDEIVFASPDAMETVRILLDRMISESAELVTVFKGETASEPLTEQLLSYLEEHYPQVEVEMMDGGQPLYDYIFSVE